MGRVVYRGYYYAYANGGVSYAHAYYDASYANTHVGSRLEIKIYRRTTMRTRSSMWCRGKRATATASMKGRKAETSSVGIGRPLSSVNEKQITLCAEKATSWRR